MDKFLKELYIDKKLSDGYKRKDDNVHSCLIEIFLRSKGWSTWYSENYWVHKEMARGYQDHTNLGTSMELAFIYEVCNLKGKTTSAEEITSAAKTEKLYINKAHELLERNTTSKEELLNG